MKTSTCALLATSALFLGACATTPSRTTHTTFEDIPVPAGLTYQMDESTVIESPRVKAARLVYRGRIEPASLAQAMRATLESNGWRNVSATSGPTAGTLQVYEKEGASLQVQIWEGGLFGMYTYLEVTAGRLNQPGSAPLPAASGVPAPPVPPAPSSSLAPPPSPAPGGGPGAHAAVPPAVPVQPMPAGAFPKTN